MSPPPLPPSQAATNSTTSPSSTTTYLPEPPPPTLPNSDTGGIFDEKSSLSEKGSISQNAYKIKDIEGDGGNADGKIGINTQAGGPAGAEGYIPPDGGWDAWLCVLGAFICQFCSFGFLNACGIFQYEYSLHLLPTTPTSTITWITTTQIFLMLLLGGGFGKLADLVGPRRVMIPSAILVVGGVCALSAGTKYWHFFLSQGVVYGIGASGLFMPAMVGASKWFEKRRGLATGIVVSGSSLGGVVFPLMATELIDKVGFAAAVRWIGLFVGIILAFAMLFIKAPYPPPGLPKRKGKDGNQGQIAGEGAQKDGAEPAAGARRILALKNPVWILFTIGCFCIFWGLLAPINYLPLMALRAGISPSFSRHLISITNGVSILGRIIPAHLSDSYGQFNVMTSIAFVSGLSVLALWLPLELSEHPSHAGIIAFAALYGLASGGFISMMTPCMMSMETGRGMVDLPIRMGVFMVVMSIASLTGLPIQGALLDNDNGGFVGLMAFSGTTMVVGGFLVAWARMIKGNWKLVGKV